MYLSIRTFRDSCWVCFCYRSPWVFVAFWFSFFVLIGVISWTGPLAVHTGCNPLGIGTLPLQLSYLMRACDFCAPFVLVDTWVLTGLGHGDTKMRSLPGGPVAVGKEHGLGARLNWTWIPAWPHANMCTWAKPFIHFVWSCSGQGQSENESKWGHVYST